MSKTILSADISPYVSMQFSKLFRCLVTKQTQNVKGVKFFHLFVLLTKEIQLPTSRIQDL